MTFITRDTSRGQLVALPYGQVNVAASQAAVAIPVAGAAGGAVAVTALFDGDLVGLSYLLSEAGSTGVFTVSATINGAAVAASTLTVGTTTKGRRTLARGAARFRAGDTLGVTITTDAAWLPITADLVAVVAVLYELEGI